MGSGSDQLGAIEVVEEQLRGGEERAELLPEHGARQGAPAQTPMAVGAVAKTDDRGAPHCRPQVDVNEDLRMSPPVSPPTSERQLAHDMGLFGAGA